MFNERYLLRSKTRSRDSIQALTLWSKLDKEITDLSDEVEQRVQEVIQAENKRIQEELHKEKEKNVDLYQQLEDAQDEWARIQQEFSQFKMNIRRDKEIHELNKKNQEWSRIIKALQEENHKLKATTQDLEKVKEDIDQLLTEEPLSNSKHTFAS